MPTKAGTFRSRSTVGADAVTGLDFAPTGLFVVVMLADFSDAGAMAGEIFTSYTVTDGTTTRCASIRVDNNVSTSATARAWWDGIVQIDTAAAAVAEGDITLTADGFEIDWTTISAAWSVCWFAVGGDIDATVLLFDRSTTGTASVTGAGFQPKALVGVGAGLGAPPVASTGNSLLLLGAVDENVAQVGVGVTSQDADPTPNSSGRMSATAFLTRNSIGGALETAIECTSLDGDGFSYDATTHPAGARFYAVLCLGGDGLLASSVEDLAADATSGAHTQTMSGLPFQPKAGVVASSSQTAYGTTDSGHATITTGAFDNDLDQWGAAFSDRNGQAISNAREQPSDTSALLAVTLTGQPPTLDAVGAVSTVGATSLDVAWSAVKDNTIQFLWPALLLDVNLVPPPPPEPEPPEDQIERQDAVGGGTTCLLGCPETRVYVTDFCGRNVVCDITDNVTFLRWTRELDDDSECEITLHLEGDSAGQGCCECLAKFRTWRNEVIVVRGGEVVWGPGPLVTIQIQRHIAHLTARDIVAWLDVRLVHTDYDFVQADLATVAQTVIEDALTLGSARDLPQRNRDACILDNATFTETGKFTDMEIKANRQSAGETLRKLADQGLDFTVVNRALHVGADFAFGPVGPLRDEDFAEDLQVAERGLAAATKWWVSSENAQGFAGGTDPFFGLIEKGVEGQPAATSAADLGREAADRLRASNPPPFIVTVPSEGQLVATAPVCPRNLVPGTLVDLAIRELCRPTVTRERLTAVRFTLDEKGEKAGITLAPLGEHAEAGLEEGA